MKYFDEEQRGEYRKKSKRSNNIPGVGMKTINQYVIENTDDDYYDYDDEYETGNQSDSKESMYK